MFEEVVRQCIEKGLVSGRVVGTDSTHVKANASRASEELVEVVRGGRRLLGTAGRLRGGRAGGT
ncbi:MAG: hypothetical protein V8R21_01480 [Dysosmobacter sp.]